MVLHCKKSSPTGMAEGSLRGMATAGRYHGRCDGMESLSCAKYSGMLSLPVHTDYKSGIKHEIEDSATAGERLLL